MTQTRNDVRPARLADVDAIASMVAASFAEDPAWSFMLPSGTAESRAAFARALLVRRIHNGTAWVTDDCTAVAMWDRLDREDAGEGKADEENGGEGPDELWAALRTSEGEETWARITAYEDALKAVAPQRPYWYLGVLATHPDHQGRGLATAVIRPGLDAADAEGWDCWLETSTPANKAFYAGRGFTDAVPVDIPDGPPTWWLRRAIGRNPAR